MTSTTTQYSTAALLHSFHAYQGYIDLMQTFGLGNRLNALMEYAGQVRYWIGPGQLNLVTAAQCDAFFDAERDYTNWSDAGRPTETREGEHYEALQAAARPILLKYEEWMQSLPTRMEAVGN